MSRRNFDWFYGVCFSAINDNNEIVLPRKSIPLICREIAVALDALSIPKSNEIETQLRRILSNPRIQKTPSDISESLRSFINQ